MKKIARRSIDVDVSCCGHCWQSHSISLDVRIEQEDGNVRMVIENPHQASRDGYMGGEVNLLVNGAPAKSTYGEQELLLEFKEEY